MPTESEQIESLTIAIVKGYTCDGVTGWRYVTLKSGKQVAARFAPGVSRCPV